MSKIEDEGFLSKECENGKFLFVEKYLDVFQYARYLNKLSMNTLAQMKIDWEDDHKLITQTLFLRVVEMFQGIFLMLERGMMPEARILTRSLLEVAFTLIALQKKPSLINSYLDKHKKSHLRALKSSLKFKNDSLKKSVKKHGIEKLYIDKKEELKGKKLKVLTPKNWADEAELEDFYNLYYVTYSDSIHSNLSSLDDHVDHKDDEKNLCIGPSDAHLYDLLRCAIFTLIHSTHSIGIVNGNDEEVKLDEIDKRIKEFDQKYIDSAG